MTKESFGPKTGQSATNSFGFDTDKLGVLTSATLSGALTGNWHSVTLNSLAEMTAETITAGKLFSQARGKAVGAGGVSAWLDGTVLGGMVYDPASSNGLWAAEVEASPGSHILVATAYHPLSRTNASTTNAFTVRGTNDITSSYDRLGNVTNRTLTGGRVQTLSWDAAGRLLAVTQRDASTNGFDWSAVYDPLGRRLQTVHLTVTNNAVSSSLDLTNSSWYDPVVEFQEVAVSMNGQRAWKVHGPDLNGVYGGLQGIGGLEATVKESDGAVTPVLNDFYGNVVATVQQAGTVQWASTRVTGYGPAIGYDAPRLSLDVSLAEATIWRSKRIDPAGLYWLGARYFDPIGGRFLSPDPMGHAGSLDLYSYGNGDAVNFLDPDGRLCDGAFIEPLGVFIAGSIKDSFAIGVRLVKGIGEAGAIGSDMLMQSTASAFGYGAEYRGYSGLYQSIYANPSRGPTASSILIGTGESVVNVGTLGGYEMGKGIGVAAATGDYTHAQDAAFGSLLFSGSVRIMQGQGMNPLSFGRGSKTVNLGGEGNAMNGDPTGPGVINIQPSSIGGNVNAALQNAERVAGASGQQVVMAPGNQLPFASGSVRSVVANNVPVNKGQGFFGPSFTAAEIMRIVAPGGSLSGSSMPAALIQMQNMRNAIISVNSVPPLLITGGQAGRP